MKWFILENESVQGPFSAAELKSRFSHNPGNQVMVWSKILPQWTPADQWLAQADEMIRESQFQKDGGGWYYGLRGQSHGPMSKRDLIKTLSNLTNVKEVLLWTKGFPNWVTIYQVHEILEEVGINRREHPRAEISGQVKFNVQGRDIVVPLVMISQGGLGVENSQNLNVGQDVMVEIISPHLGSSIRANAAVRYISKTGYTGFKFSKIHPEAKSKIIDFVKKSTGAVVESRRAA